MTALDRASTVRELHLQMSKLLVSCVVFAIAATSALVITTLVAFPEKPGPPPGIQGVQPGPPPNVQGMTVFVIITGLFVLAWLAVLVVVARDQILQRLGATDGVAPDRDQIKDLLAEVRRELAADREREWQVMSDKLIEYGEQRETDGYLSGMRVATGGEPVEANVRSIRRPPNPR